ncbi:TonB family protein [Erythrobacter vulgaris]|uniref:TonB family protein n=1 Tax=Qipengyuania vulgaris TaxID=291985 RepID=A0A844XP55_9SPHN|nr:TonB family protein [Qipengyuania vulgaris]MXO47204.1 TonB family protein [Qipengyuania vulgaris]
MSKYRVAALGVMLALSASSASAQDESEARGASPRDLMEWARQIQMAYPAAALRNEEDGTVTMQIRIGADGRVQGCDVTGSSGSAALDEAACSGMKEHARYNPARNSAGEPIASSTAQSVRYVLPDGGWDANGFKPASLINGRDLRERIFDEDFVSAIEAAPGDKALFALTIDPTGNPTGCGMIFSTGNGALDQETCAALMEEAEFSPAKAADGTNVPGFSVVPYPEIDTL